MKKELMIILMIALMSMTVLAGSKRWEKIECKSDINQDGIVDIQDFGLLKSHLGERVKYHINKNRRLPYSNQPIDLINSDIDSNGIVGLRDYMILRRYFGTRPNCEGV